MTTSTLCLMLLGGLSDAFVPFQRTRHLNPRFEKGIAGVEADESFTSTERTENKETFLKSLKDTIQFTDHDYAASGDYLTTDPFEPLNENVVILDNVESVLEASAKAAMEADASLTAEGVEAILSPSKDAVAGDEVSRPADMGIKLTFGRSATRTASQSDGSDVDAAVVSFTDSSLPKKVTMAAPGVAKILRFAVPAIGVWLFGPLLSLIDTGSVGLLSGTAQQAALNPAVAVTDYSALLIAFLFTGSTNLIAAAQESDRLVDGSPRTTRTLIGALQLSVFVGTSLASVLFVGAPLLLRAIIGNENISPEVLDAALKYVRIRALGMPAAAVIGSAQAACLGMQDIRSPLYVLFAAAVVNFIGDVLFVGSKHPWVGGAAGAAWATVFSQYAALAMFIHWLCNRPRDVVKPKILNVSNAILELTGKPRSPGEGRRRRFLESLRRFKLYTEASKAKLQTSGRLSLIAGPLARLRRKNPVKQKSSSEDTVVSVRGFLDGKFNALDLVKAPAKETLHDFKPYLLPVTTTVVGRVSGYVAMSHVVSSSLGTISMAAQQVILSLFYCLCPIADSLSLTAQSFVPGMVEQSPSPDRSLALRQTTSNFVKAAVVFGGIMATAVGSIPFLSGMFTTDPAVVSLVNMVAPLLVGFFGVHGLVCAAEGLLLGQKDLSFLGRMYAMFFAVVPFLMLRVKRAAIAGCEQVNLASVWKVFVGYQLFRSVAWAVRLAVLQRRQEQQCDLEMLQP